MKKALKFTLKNIEFVLMTLIALSLALACLNNFYFTLDYVWLGLSLVCAVVTMFCAIALAEK